MVNIAIFVSGGGTNCENLIRHFEHSETVNCALVVSNKPDAYALVRAERLGVPTIVLPKAQLNTPDETLPLLQKYGIDFIVLAGYLVLVPKYLVDAYPRAIVNIHPALIPLHCGKGMYGDRVHEDVIRCGDTESGITIHYVNELFDNGDIIFQAKCPVEPGDDAHAVAEKVHRLEYAHFPRVIEQAVRALSPEQ